MVSAEDSATYDKMEADVLALGKEVERLERQAAIDRGAQCQPANQAHHRKAPSEKLRRPRRARASDGIRSRRSGSAIRSQVRAPRGFQRAGNQAPTS